MKVLLACSPIEGLGGRQACSVATKAWREVRPGDEIRAWAVSDGRPVPGGTSGLDEVLGGVPAPLESHPRLHAWRTESQVLFDYTNLLALDPFDGIARQASSSMIGKDLAWAGDEGLRQAVVALPGPSAVSDLGFAILDALAPETAGAGLGERIRAARARLGALHVTTLAADEQRLTGFRGIARTRMRRDGLCPHQAQIRDAEVAENVEAIAEACAGAVASLLGSGPDPRGAYAGSGGGAAFMLEALGARTCPVGDVAVRTRLAAHVKEVDIALYVASQIEAGLPSGLLALIDEAPQETPVVLVYDHGGIARTELRGLQVAGAYELRPDLAFMPREGAGPGVDPKEMAGILGERIRVVARTWGY